MRKPNKLLLFYAPVTLAVASLLMLLLMASPPPDPVYKGAPLSEWLAIYDGRQSTVLPAADGPQAGEAIRAIGTNGIPALLAWLTQEWRPSKVREWVTATVSRFTFLHRFPPLSRWWYARDPREFRADAAVFAFKALGPSASPALPGLVRVATSAPDPGAGRRAVDALVNIGPASLPALLALITNQNAEARFYAAISIQQLGPSAAPAIPILINCLTDPALASAAYETLGRLKLEPQLVLPALAKTAQGSDPLSRALAILTLGDFGQEARATLPTLLLALSDTNAAVRESATNAAQQVAPELLSKGPDAQSRP